MAFDAVRFGRVSGVAAAPRVAIDARGRRRRRRRRARHRARHHEHGHGANVARRDAPRAPSRSPDPRRESDFARFRRSRLARASVGKYRRRIARREEETRRRTGGRRCGRSAPQSTTTTTTDGARAAWVSRTTRRDDATTRRPRGGRGDSCDHGVETGDGEAHQAMLRRERTERGRGGAENAEENGEE